jgi:phosphoenolpyruvate carboxykinase (GTP)
VFDRCDGTAEASETPIGYLPTKQSLDTKGLNVSADVLDLLLDVDVAGWKAELPSIEEHFASFGDKLPQGLRDELAALSRRLDEAR